jgi:capsule polysaccharide modification protein KpsS
VAYGDPVPPAAIEAEFVPLGPNTDLINMCVIGPPVRVTGSAQLAAPTAMPQKPLARYRFACMTAADRLYFRRMRRYALGDARVWSIQD